MTALRACVALCVLSLTACDNLLGLHDIQPDGEPTALVLTVADTGVAQQPLGPIAVTVLDVRGKPVTDYTGVVTLTLGNHPGGGTLLGTLTAPVTDGRAGFDVVGIDRPGAGYTLVASSGTLPPVTSDPIAIAAPRFTPVATGTPGGSITSIAVSPSASGGPPTVFAGAADGVYKSVDGGASWKLANFGGAGAGQLAADRNHPGVVYLHGGSGTVKRTVDGGATWHDLSSPGSSTYISTFAVDPTNSSVIYAAGSRFLRSSDGGATWTNVGVQVCNQIAVDPVVRDTVYCTAYDSSTSASILYKSSNAGVSWGPAGNGLPSGYIGVLAATPTGVFVAVNSVLHRTIDGGASWTNASLAAYALAYAPSMPERIYVETPGGIAVSGNGGASFGPRVDVGDPIRDLTVDPTNPDVVYAAGASVGVLVSTNGGASWAVSSSGIDAHPIGSVAVAPAAPSTALITTGAAVMRTIDGGASWTTIAQVNATISFDPAISTRAYLCGPGYFATSINSGASFTGGMSPSLNGACTRLVAAGGRLYAVASSQVYRSDDGGASWAKVGLGSDRVVSDVALGDATGDTVVATTADGIFQSTNGGTSFTQVTTGGGYYGYGIVADPKLPTRVIVGACPGFHISTDGGATFEHTTNGPCVSHLTSAGGALYVTGTGFGGAFSGAVLWTSSNGGTSWNPIDTSGIPSGVFIGSIAASDDGTAIYLGTQAGVYRGRR